MNLHDHKLCFPLNLYCKCSILLQSCREDCPLKKIQATLISFQMVSFLHANFYFRGDKHISKSLLLILSNASKKSMQVGKNNQAALQIVRDLDASLQTQATYFHVSIAAYLIQLQCDITSRRRAGYGIAKPHIPRVKTTGNTITTVAFQQKDHCHPYRDGNGFCNLACY